MNYYVCFQNCIDDYFNEDAPSLKFDSFDGAIRYLVSLAADSEVPVPDPEGEIKGFFPGCEAEECLEVYQIINIIPGIRDPMVISDCYCDDADAVASMRRDYLLDRTGKVRDVRISKIEYVERDPDE